MAHNIYSFIKIEKRQTKRGIYAAAFGIVSLICMAVLTIASFIKEGDLPAAVGGIGYLSFLAAIFGLWLSVQLRKDNEASGGSYCPRIYFFCGLFINYYVRTALFPAGILDVRLESES